MKKTLSLLTLTTAILLNGCGGGGSASTDTQSVYYDGFVPLMAEPSTFICAKEESEKFYALDNNSSQYNVMFYSSLEECKSEMDKWVKALNQDDEIATQEQEDALAYLNNIRANVGLPIFHNNKHLQQATLNHELYLNDVVEEYGVNTTHYEDNENYPSEYFTGRLPTDRANYAGYSGVYAGDVISFSNDNIISSIDTLLTAIYHRKALLWNDTNEIGIGGTQNDFAFPHLMGKKENRESFLSAISTDVTLYPYNGQDNFQTTFLAHGESPDPMPDVDEDMGNPIYVGFNPYYHINSNIKMTSFKLYDENDNEIECYEVLDKSNDPSPLHFFKDGQYALFAKEPLEEGKKYKAIFRYTEDGQSKEIEWEFTTEKES